jgi:hypothetical protein
MSEFNPILEDNLSTEGHNEFVDQVKIELEEIDSSDLSEHSARFESLHAKLQQALTSIDGL